MTDEQFEKQWKLYGELRLAEDEEYKALKNNTFVFRWYDTVAFVVCYVLGDRLVTRFIHLKELASFVVQIIFFLIFFALYTCIRSYLHRPPTEQEVEERVKRKYREELEHQG